MTIEANFLVDFAALKAEELKRHGYKVTPATAPQDTVLQFYSVLNRLIPPRPRRVFKAKTFTCPASRTAGLDQLLEKVRRGEDLNTHQSDSLFRANYADDLLNHWGLNHFHLGVVPHATNPFFAGRTDNVLFALVTEDIVYCIDVMPHKDENGDSNLACQRLMQILYDNWPHAIEEYRVGVRAGKRLTDEEVRQMRDVGLVCSITMNDGSVFGAIGGGYTMGGHHKPGHKPQPHHSWDTCNHADTCCETIGRMEKEFREGENRMRNELSAEGVTVPDPLRVSLAEDNDYFYAVVHCVPEVPFRLREKASLVAA